MSCLQAVIHFVLTRRYVRYQTIFNDSNDELLTRQGWRSRENTRFPPMWLGLDYETRRHICGLRFVGSLLCTERCFSGHSGFPLSSKTSTWIDLRWSLISFYYVSVDNAPIFASALEQLDTSLKFLSFPWLILKGFPIAFLVLLLSVLTLLLWGNQLISRTLGHFVEADLNFDKQF